MIEILPIGGYSEVGKNSTAVKIGEEVCILDFGLSLENYIKYTQDEDDLNLSSSELVKAGAIPDVSAIGGWKDKVKMILPTHAHLDHIGALPYIQDKIKAPIMATPFTAEVLKSIANDKKIKMSNKINSMHANSIFNLSSNIKVEFVHVTHSTPHTVIIALHTPEGIIIYANDFKFDMYPTLGKTPNLKRLAELGNLGVRALIVDSLYAHDERKMPSETVAKHMLREVMLNTDSKGKLMVVTTFASHIARLNSIVEFGKKLNRRIVFMGRSISRYVEAAERSGVIKFSKDVEIVKFGKQMKKEMKKVQRERDKYLLVVTGHQGEPKSTLSKIATGELGFEIQTEDHIIFSSKVIPTKMNINNSRILDSYLRKRNARIFRNVHESGHAAREDLRDLIHILKPEHIIPTHGDSSVRNDLAELSAEMGYKKGSNTHMLNDGQKIRI